MLWYYGRSSSSSPPLPPLSSSSPPLSSSSPPLSSSSQSSLPPLSSSSYSTLEAVSIRLSLLSQSSSSSPPPPPPWPPPWPPSHRPLESPSCFFRWCLAAFLPTRIVCALSGLPGGTWQMVFFLPPPPPPPFLASSSAGADITITRATTIPNIMSLFNAFSSHPPRALALVRR